MNLIAPDPLYLDHASRDERVNGPERRSPRGRAYRELLDEHRRTVQHLGFLAIVVIPLIVGLAWAFTDARDRQLEAETQLTILTATLAARDVAEAQWDCKFPPTLKGDIKTCIRVAAKNR